MTKSRTSSKLFLLFFLIGNISSYITDGDEISPQRMWDPEKNHIFGQNIKMIFSKNVTQSNHTSQVGMTTFLRCHVHGASNRKVSWIRVRDNHILTSGRQSYSSDGRFSVFRDDQSSDWVLKIKFIQTRDKGRYECQVSTQTGSFTHIVNLKVVVPKTVIVGASEIHVQSGSTISLKCIIKDAVVNPQYIFWYRNNNMINYDQSRGGIHVKTERLEEPTSHLMITDGKFNDSGNYTCKADSIAPASVNVFVSEGDKPAAIQKLESSAAPKPSKISKIQLVICSYILIVVAHLADTNPIR